MSTLQNFIAVVLLLATSEIHAFEQTYESCGVFTWRLIKVISLHKNEVPLKKAKSEINGSSKNLLKDTVSMYKLINEKGYKTAHISSHIFYLKCVREVYSRVKTPNSKKQKSYMRCASSSNERLKILLNIDRGKTVHETKQSMKSVSLQLIDELYNVASKNSLLYVLNLSSESTADCISKNVALYR
jgi:hypothetical protein